MKLAIILNIAVIVLVSMYLLTPPAEPTRHEIIECGVKYVIYELDKGAVVISPVKDSSAIRVLTR